MSGKRNPAYKTPAQEQKPKPIQNQLGTWVIAVLLLASIAAAASVVARHYRQPPYVPLRIEVLDPRPALLEYEREAHAQIMPRPVFPYSVITGGVRTEDELRGAMARDPIVARHYAGFDLRDLRLVALDQDVWAYVSYRVPSGVFWTTKRAHLKRGEAVLTDGVHMARGRCANQVFVLPQFPVLARGPVPETMEDPGELIPPGAEPIAPVLRPPVLKPKTPQPPVISIITITGGGGGGDFFGISDPGGPVNPRKPRPSRPDVPAGGTMPAAEEIFLCALLALWLRRQRAEQL
jgi:hypothetical protein